MIAKLTVIILTKNEELHIERAIKSVVNIADKIIIIDSYSTDRTKEICLNIKDKEFLNIEFVERKFISHYDQFNWVLNKVKIDSDWIMRLDADEFITKELSEEILYRLSGIDNDVTGIILNRRIVFLGKWIRHGGIYPLKVLRVFRKNFGYCESREMDEHIVVTSGKIINFNNDIVDENLNDLTWWINKHNWYSNKEVTSYIEYRTKNRENANLDKLTSIKRLIKEKLYYNSPYFFRAHIFFIIRYLIRFGFLDGREGFLFHFFQGLWYRTLVDAKLFEKEKLNL